jgi:DNA-binding response OmpR family regulator
MRRRNELTVRQKSFETRRNEGGLTRASQGKVHLRAFPDSTSIQKRLAHALTVLYELLEEYAPQCYTHKHRVITETALACFEASLDTLQPHEGVHEFDGLRVDLRRIEVTLNGQPVRLKAREFELLRYLIERPDITISRTELLEAIWGYDSDSFTRTVDVHIATLRKKLERDPVSPKMILTIPGMGYRFERRT